MNLRIPLVKFGNVLRRVGRFEKRDDLLEYQFAGTYSFGRGVFAGEKKNGSSFQLDKIQRIRTGDFVYCKIMAWEGAFGLVPERCDGCVMSGAFVVYEVDTEKIDPKFLDYYFKIKSNWEAIGNQSTGTNVRRRSLHPNQFEAATMPNPPLSEQRRIVARIEELAARIEEARELRRRAVEETDALAVARIAQIFLEYEVGGIRKGILGDYVIDDRYGTSEKTTDDKSRTPVLRMGNIQNGHLDIRDLKYLEIYEKDRKHLILRKGDILVNRTNSAELVGKSAVFDLEGEYSFASYLIRLRLDQETADPKLISLYINSPAGRAYMFSERKQMTGQANVNSKKLKALPICLPNILEQRRMIAHLDALQSQLDALKRHQSETAAALDALLPAVLERAFRGEL